MDEEKKIELYQYRVGLCSGSIIYLFFGWFSERFLNTSYDSFMIRLPISMATFLFFGASYKSEFIRKKLRYIYFACASYAVFQYISIFAQSNYHFYFSIGLMAMPYVAFTFFFHPIDVVLYFIFVLASGLYLIQNNNIVFSVVYLILSLMAFAVYLMVTRNRINLLKRLKVNLVEIQNQKNEIEDKSKSLVKIGELAAQVAHDIRSPVTALAAVAQALGNEIDTKKKKLIENAAKRINDIATNLVLEYRENLTKDLSSLKIDRTINLNSLIEDIIEEKKLSLDSRYKIILKSPESIFPPENLDFTEFQRVISNLINNSIEAFNKENGIIDIELFRKESKIKIVIRDNGKGIPADKVRNVFDKGVTSKSDGIGFGLAHAKEYIESIGGKISITSILGKETSVTIVI